MRHESKLSRGNKKGPLFAAPIGATRAGRALTWARRGTIFDFASVIIAERRQRNQGKAAGQRKRAAARHNCLADTLRLVNLHHRFDLNDSQRGRSRQIAATKTERAIADPPAFFGM
jgi:hypothetical protein